MVLALRVSDMPTEPATSTNYWTLGGPQGQFRVANGIVSGPFYRFAEAVHSYEGATIGDLIGDMHALRLRP